MTEHAAGTARPTASIAIWRNGFPAARVIVRGAADLAGQRDSDERGSGQRGSGNRATVPKECGRKDFAQTRVGHGKGDPKDLAPAAISREATPMRTAQVGLDPDPGRLALAAGSNRRCSARMCRNLVRPHRKDTGTTTVGDLAA